MTAHSSAPDGPMLPEDTLLSVRHVSKKFCRHLRRSMAYGIMDLSRNLVGLPSDTTKLRKNEFWAVEDVSFDLKRGETLGLIGINGSGKTTMLRLLSGIFPPDRGEIVVRGRVGMLIAVGAGFHPHMTGRENIYLNGTILGMTRKEIDAKFRGIVDFAEIGDFLDAPVAIYSSGMRVRLGFAIAVSIEPDILLVDEILAVGDIAFRAKCFNAIDRIARNSAIIFVSHQMPQVMRISSKLIVMDRGRTVYHGSNLPEGIEYYHSRLEMETPTSSVAGSGKAVLHELRVSADRHPPQAGTSPVKVRYLSDLNLEMSFSLDRGVGGVVMAVAFFDKEMRGGAECYSDNCKFSIANSGERMNIRVKFPKLPLNPGIYSVTLTWMDENRGETLLRIHAVRDIHVVGDFVGFSSVQLQGEWAVV